MASKPKFGKSGGGGGGGNMACGEDMIVVVVTALVERDKVRGCAGKGTVFRQRPAPDVTGSDPQSNQQAPKSHGHV